jgi:putative ABC transport system permease protein
MEQIAREVRHALRSLARAPILATVIILSLAIGISVNTVVFSWIQALVFRPLPGVSNASEFHVIEIFGETGGRPGASWLEYRDLAERLDTVRELVAFRMVPLNIGETSRNERTYALLVSGNYFSGLGIRPAVGRTLRPDDVTRPGAEPVVMISYDYWQTRFAGTSDAIGQILRANGRDLTIVGVTPEGFQGSVLGLQFDLWVPATMAPTLLAGSRELDDRNLRGYFVMGRLANRTAVDQAQAEVNGAMQQLAQSYPEANRNMRAEILPYWRATRGPQGLLLQGLGILQGIMLLLLLAVCGNTANLMLARASTRQREIGVRVAMGAGAWRIVRLLLVENLALGLIASALGIVMAMWGTQALRALPFSTAFPVRFQTSIDAVGLGFAIGLGALCALVFGAAPALHLAPLDPQTILRSGGLTGTRPALRNALMAAEVALALAVLISAGLFFRGMQQTREDPGFQRAGLLLAAYDLTGRNIDGPGAREFARRLLQELQSNRDIEVAAISTSVPLDIHGLPQRSFVVEGRARSDGSRDRALSNTVTPGYFAAMRIPILEGQDFADLADTTAPAQVMVNQEFVRRFVPSAEVLGRRIENNGRSYVITGVVRDSLYDSFGEPPTPALYFSYRDRPSGQGEIHVRARVGEETLLAPAVRRAVRTLDPALPVYNVRTMMQHVETNLVLRRIPARMFVVLGPLLLVLAAIGIYAVVAYTVAHRTIEIGVRIALGATAPGVVRHIVRESLRVVIAGAALGWLLVFMLYTHLVRGAIDLASFVGVPAVLLAVAALASWIPARRATSVDPVVALRHE